ncbi:MAG TPA: hypothetical protein VMU33_01360 [Burkholderiaceae bacterium]|nr:hypothetical protein [Burkholderiaceae bacterium]
MSTTTEDRPAPSTSRINLFGSALLRFAVGCFGGALASFFPRLMAVLGGDPMRHVQLFSIEYIRVGIIVALVVGLVIVIVDSSPNRRMRDVFMNALGIPTLLMGSLSTSATSSNLESLQQQLTSTTASLQAAAKVPLGDADASIPAPDPAPQSRWDPAGFLVRDSYAQDRPGADAAVVADSNLGLSAPQRNYYVIYARGATQQEVAPVQKALADRGIASRIVEGSRHDYLVVPGDGALKPYAAAVQSAVKAQGTAGAKPYIVPAPGN